VKEEPPELSFTTMIEETVCQRAKREFCTPLPNNIHWSAMIMYRTSTSPVCYCGMGPSLEKAIDRCFTCSSPPWYWAKTTFDRGNTLAIRTILLKSPIIVSEKGKATRIKLPGTGKKIKGKNIIKALQYAAKISSR
jgi:hypothetical protein